MSFFVFPQKWIAAAIAAGATAFGPLDQGPVTVTYVKLPGSYLAATDPPTRIGIDKRPRSAWPKWKVTCVIAHEYGHLAGRRHSRDPASIMYRRVGKTNCYPFLRRHGIRQVREDAAMTTFEPKPVQSEPKPAEPPVDPYANKAIATAVTTLVTTGIQWAISGDFQLDQEGITVLGGAVATVLVYVVSNWKKLGGGA